MKLNEKIYWCRKKAGLSQEALAEVIGVSRQSISKWETGEASPEIGKLPLLAKAFGVTADWLLSEDSIPEDEPAAETAPQPSAPPEAPSWPVWVENLPGFIGKAVKKFGWLYGVKTALGGALFTLFGCLMRAVTGSFFSTASNMMDPFFGESASEVVFFDSAGNVISDPVYADQFFDAIGRSYSHAPSITNTASGPFDLISGFVIFIGVAMMIAGAVMAVLLKRWGKKESL